MKTQEVTCGEHVMRREEGTELNPGAIPTFRSQGGGEASREMEKRPKCVIKPKEEGFWKPRHEST